MKRVLRHREGAGDLDHLAPPDREVRDDGVRRDAVAGKDLVELGADHVAGAPTPAPARDGRMQDARVLRDRQIRAERKLLEHAADAERLRGDDRIGFTQRALDQNLAGVGGERAGEDVHQRRLAGAVVADQTDALSALDGKIHAVERVDGAEMLFDAVQLNNIGACLGHSQQVPSRTR